MSVWICWDSLLCCFTECHSSQQRFVGVTGRFTHEKAIFLFFVWHIPADVMKKFAVVAEMKHEVAGMNNKKALNWKNKSSCWTKQQWFVDVMRALLITLLADRQTEMGYMLDKKLTVLLNCVWFSGDCCLLWHDRTREYSSRRIGGSEANTDDVSKRGPIVGNKRPI